MRKLKDITLNNKQITFLELTLILFISVYPIFLNYPYTLNIFLSWDGAYRLYLGQIPYKDFGLPMGFGYWILPALFFKLFGPYLITLIKAQAFINIISALAFRSILKQLKVTSGIRILSILVYLITFVSLNIWPWYNNTVITYEFIGIAFILNYVLNKNKRYPLIRLFWGCFFLFLSFFTKQDAGMLGLLIAIALIICDSLYTRKIWPAVWFLVFYVFSALCFFLPFISHHISYWFNYGQPPHFSRLSLYDIFSEFFGKSEWLKFFIIIIFLIWMTKLKKLKEHIRDKNFVVFSLLTIGVLTEASIFQVTSYVPGYNNIFFYSFAIAYILSYCGLSLHINFQKLVSLILTGAFILLWWSGRVWPYADKAIGKLYPNVKAIDTNEVSMRSYMRPDPHSNSWMTSLVPDESKWKYSPWKAFNRISMPEPTIQGIQRLLDNPIIKDKRTNLKLLNMSELTPLAEVIGYTPETGNDIPLWYHKNVAMFEKQIKEYEAKIDNNFYDVVLFEYIPILNNFYPFEIRDYLKEHYLQVDSFPAPRDVYYKVIEVYTKKVNK